MTDKLPTAASVEFQNGAIIPVEAVWDYVDNVGADQFGYFIVTKVHWEEGHWSWGKGWYDNTAGDNVPPRLCRVGAGAYGDMTILERPLVNPRLAWGWR